MQETVGLVMVNERERGNVLSVESEADSSFPNRRPITFVSCSLICSVIMYVFRRFMKHDDRSHTVEHLICSFCFFCFFLFLKEVL